uniref:Uncharacterized protein n=1 Tax=Moniliophthora roreri TaxID=221103 RepID=A0A0W0GBE8_MONRR
MLVPFFFFKSPSSKVMLEATNPHSLQCCLCAAYPQEPKPLMSMNT